MLCAPLLTNPDSQLDSQLNNPLAGMYEAQADAIFGGGVAAPIVPPMAVPPMVVPVKVRPWQDRSDPLGHIEAMNTAIKDNNLEMVKAMRRGYPTKLFKTPADYKLSTRSHHPVYIAVVYGTLAIADALVNYKQVNFSCADPFLANDKTSISDETVFSYLLSIDTTKIKTKKPRVFEAMLLMLANTVGGKLVNLKRWTKAGRAAIANHHVFLLRAANKNNLFSKNKWAVYHSAIRIAFQNRSYKSLAYLLGCYPSHAGQQCIHEGIRDLYNSKPSGPTPEHKRSDLADINLCVLVMWIRGRRVSDQMLSRMSETHHRFALWYKRATDHKRVDHPTNIAEVAMAFRNEFVIGLAVHDDPEVYTRAQRETMVDTALERAAIQLGNAPNPQVLRRQHDRRLRPHGMKIHPINIKTVRWARSWSIKTHQYMSKGTRAAVFTFIMCLYRLRVRGHAELPSMPAEMWFAILASGPV